MAEITAKIFRSGRTQAVRIPVELSFATETVTIERRGEGLILRPHYENGWARFFADPSLVLPEDFETGKDQLQPGPR
jgi:virulence-associated protein VagC